MHSPKYGVFYAQGFHLRQSAFLCKPFDSKQEAEDALVKDKENFLAKGLKEEDYPEYVVITMPEYNKP